MSELNCLAFIGFLYCKAVSKFFKYKPVLVDSQNVKYVLDTFEAHLCRISRWNVFGEDTETSLGKKMSKKCCNLGEL